MAEGALTLTVPAARLKTMTIRHAMVAGSFYPADARTLDRDVRRFLDQAPVDPAGGRVAGLIAPHAGYVYSGVTAGHAFARARGHRPERVILLGRSHRHFFEGASIFERGAFATPAGDLPVDEAFAGELAARFGAGPVEAHYPEHSLEVQLPFILAAWGPVPIIPVLFGSDAAPWHTEFGHVLAELLNTADLVVASTDLSHYLPESLARPLDEASLNFVLGKDCDALIDAVARNEASMCGAPAVAAAMACALARGASAWRLLDYRTSAAASGDYDRVVGYGAVSMEWEAA
jgi:AmmeMemoRadiSam system protein B